MVARSQYRRPFASAEGRAALESLHHRIAQVDGAIAAEEHQQTAVSHNASQAQVEVSVLGEAAHAAGAFALGRRLHDAGRILAVSLAVLLIALAVLIPLMLLLGALLIGARGWRRQPTRARARAELNVPRSTPPRRGDYPNTAGRQPADPPIDIRHAEQRSDRRGP